LDLEASPEVVPSCVGLVVAAVVRPVQRVLDDVFGLVGDVEQAPDLGNGEREQSADGLRGRARRGRG
jgi:hypothetical protein